MNSNVTRRDVLKGAGVLGLGAMAGIAPKVQAASRGDAASKPNIVLFYIDDLGYGDIGCFGSPLVSTPNIDGMASRGMRMTDYYAGSPVCTPSRTALLTGCLAPRVNMANVFQPNANGGLSPNEKTMPEYLKEVGYATGIFGKWHLGNPARSPSFNPLNHGFDRWYGLPYSNDQRPTDLYDQTTIVQTFTTTESQKPLTRMVSEQAMAWIRANAAQPFFAYIPINQPHEPLASEWVGRSRGGQHGDSVEEIDYYVGEVLKLLSELGIRENTMVIFTSDNGPWYIGNPGDFYGRKVETYEGGMREPFVIEWPGVVPAGAVYREPVQNVDLLPTLAEAIDFQLLPNVKRDGVSILPALTQRGRKVDRGDIFYYDDTSTGGNLNAVRRGDWKCHRRRANGPYFTARGAVPNEEVPQLFNLRTDPTESYDLSTRQPDLVQELLKRMADFDAELRADALTRPRASV